MLCHLTKKDGRNPNVSWALLQDVIFFVVALKEMGRKVETKLSLVSHVHVLSR